MKLLRSASILIIVLAALTAIAQQTQRPAPRLVGFAVQGISINLDNYKGKQPVLVVFYRTHN